MQFNNRIMILFSEYNDFGEPLPDPASKVLRCRIIEHHKALKTEAEAKARRYDMKLYFSGKAFAPYQETLGQDKIQFKYQGVIFEPVMISALRDFGGRVKYFDVELSEVGKDGS